MKHYLDPVKCVQEARKHKDMGRSLLILAIASVLFAVSLGLGLNRLGSVLPSNIPMTATRGVGVAILGFSIFFLGGLFLGWLTKLTFHILGGKGHYYKGLSTVVYSLKYISVGILLAVLLSYIPFLGGLLAFLSVSTFGVISYATLYRAARELFGVDMITAFVGISVIFAVIMLSFYGSVAFGAGGMFQGLGGLTTG